MAFNEEIISSFSERMISLGRLKDRSNDIWWNLILLYPPFITFSFNVVKIIIDFYFSSVWLNLNGQLPHCCESLVWCILCYKLDGVGPVDNRLFTNKLHHLVWRRKIHTTCDTWHVTWNMWHGTCIMWYVTCGIWHVEGGEHSLKISAS